MVRYAKIHSFITVVLILLCGCLLVSLINERSRDVVRVTVPSNELLSTAQQLQGITRKVAYAYPSNGDELTATKWTVVIDSRSEANR